MTLSDLEWPFHASRAISAVAELLVLSMGVMTLLYGGGDVLIACLFVGLFVCFSRCISCGGDGRIVCRTCQGYKHLKCFINLRIE